MFRVPRPQRSSEFSPFFQYCRVLLTCYSEYGLETEPWGSEYEHLTSSPMTSFTESQAGARRQQFGSELFSLFPLLCAVFQRFRFWKLLCFSQFTSFWKPVSFSKEQHDKKRMSDQFIALSWMGMAALLELQVGDPPEDSIKWVDSERERDAFQARSLSRIVILHSLQFPHFSLIKNPCVASWHFLAVLKVTMHLLLRNWNCVRASEPAGAGSKGGGLTWNLAWLWR